MPILNVAGVAPAQETITLPPDAQGKVARLNVRPWGAGQRLAALRAYWQALAATNDVAIADVAYTVGAIGSAVIGWEGFEGPDGEPLAFAPELVDALKDLIAGDYDLYSEIHAQYVAPALAREAEKNGSSLPRAGGSPAEAKKAQANRSSSAGVAGTTAARAKRPARPARSATASRGAKTAN